MRSALRALETQFQELMERQEFTERLLERRDRPADRTLGQPEADR